MKTKLSELLKQITPLPWQFSVVKDEHERLSAYVNAHNSEISNADVCDLCGRGSKLEEAKSNGRYLTHCANNFPALVEAATELRSATKEVSRVEVEYPAGTCNCEEAWSDAGTRLRAAEKSLDDALAAAETVTTPDE